MWNGYLAMRTDVTREGWALRHYCSTNNNNNYYMTDVTTRVTDEARGRQHNV